MERLKTFLVKNFKFWVLFLIYSVIILKRIVIYLYKKNQKKYKNNQTFIFIYNIPEKREATHFLREILLKVLSDLKVI